MEHTPKLALPYILAAQAQKHVTHNEALRRLDQIIHLSLRTLTPASTATSSPEEGDAYLVATNADGVWTDHPGDIATYHEGD
ncbi:DUF2793 domain-containing protein [Pseudahrensia aquimaris]|uniref:DUF2793 domain-containing protein n=1 Tax=Pseudahrensia aquimaris TaxID=744461 RepID=A0ABW3FI35_9HYPH